MSMSPKIKPDKNFPMLKSLPFPSAMEELTSRF
jgi:hypothetical protein